MINYGQTNQAIMLQLQRIISSLLWLLTMAIAHKKMLENTFILQFCRKSYLYMYVCIYLNYGHEHEKYKFYVISLYFL